MNYSKHYIPAYGSYIIFDGNTYSAFATSNVDSDTYLLGLRQHYIHKLNIIDHVKYMFPDKFLYQRIR